MGSVPALVGTEQPLQVSLQVGGDQQYWERGSGEGGAGTVAALVC